MNETIHDDGSDDDEEDTSASQAAVNDLRLGIHPLSLLAIREGGEAGTDKGVKE